MRTRNRPRIDLRFWGSRRTISILPAIADTNELKKVERSRRSSAAAARAGALCGALLGLLLGGLMLSLPAVKKKRSRF